MAKEQLNNLIVARGLAKDVDDATRRIIAREVKVNDAYVTSPCEFVDAEAEIAVKSELAYVSRGGIKLKAAIEAFEVEISGKNCLDIGSSTGGFTDCLMQEGAVRVACVDVNYGQLAWKIREDARVDVFERTNIKSADPNKLGSPFDVVVVDVSFIGLATLAPVIEKFCYDEKNANRTDLLALVKPEFEAARGENEGGLVEDENVRQRTVEEVKEALTQCNFAVLNVIESPIKGKKKGNTEFLIHAKH